MNHLCGYLRDLMEKREIIIRNCNDSFTKIIDPMRQIVELYDEQLELKKIIESVRKEITEDNEKEESL